MGDEENCRIFLEYSSSISTINQLINCKRTLVVWLKNCPPKIQRIIWLAFLSHRHLVLELEAQTTCNLCDENSILMGNQWMFF